MCRISFCICVLASTVSAQLSLTHLATVDVSPTSNSANPEFIGSNPSAVAWNGVDLWLAGYNNTAAAANTAIVKVSTALTSPSFGTSFGVVAATPSGRGYSGLAFGANEIAASHDFGTASPEGISVWDQNGNNAWLKAGRGSSGVAFDPGFFGVAGNGTGWTTFSSGRRALQDTATGADIYTAANGMIVNAGTGTLWRDMDFNPVNGDIYLRRSNEIVRCDRTGPNSVTNNQVLVAPTSAPFINNQNLEFMQIDILPGYQVLIWNDRSTGGNGQPFDQVIMCSLASDGSAVPIDYRGFTAPAGAGAYDFSYDGVSGTLAISDFSNRSVYIFAVSLFTPFGTGCAGQSNITPVCTASGDTRAGGSITFAATNAAPSSFGGFVFGNYQANIPIPFPGACPQHVTPFVFSAGLFFTSAGPVGSGTGSWTFNLGPGLAGIPLTAQAVIVENGSLSSIVTSVAVETVLQ